MKNAKTRHFTALLKTAILCACFLLASAQIATAQPEQYSSARIFPERGTVKPGETITLAIEFRLAPHWHIYWRNPGDSGFPVTIRWDLPEGFKASEIDWPTPEKISYDTLVNYGFYNPVTLLQTIKVPQNLPQGEIKLKAEYELLVCNNICIPEYGELAFSLNDPNTPGTDNSALVAAARTQIPQKIEGSFSFRKDDKALHLSLIPEDSTILPQITKNSAEFFPYDWGIINHAAAPQVVIENDKLTITHELGSEAIDPAKPLDGLLVIKGETGKNKSYEISAVSSGINTGHTPENSTPEIVHNITWISALALAFFGGLALNLMPCVFPVLSIKALSLIEMRGHAKKQARLHGIAYTLGIILSFLLIAGALIAFKHAGAAIGWGFQLQNPLIIGVLAALFFLIGMNLLGVFEIGLSLVNLGNIINRHCEKPRYNETKASDEAIQSCNAKTLDCFTNARNDDKNILPNKNYTASFFTGTLATLVATPCTAPFMGAAMGFALTQSAAISLSVFAMLGFGMALPYLLLSFIPALRTILPRPGPWMNTFKKALSIPIFATMLWLLWVLSIQTAIINAPENHSAIPYNKAALSELLESDDAIFVEMTAAWCITCKANEAAILKTKTVRDLFKEKNIHLVIGDWTNRNAEISEYLDSFRRNGVPLYVYYAPRDPLTGERPDAVILPQILTTNALKHAIEQ